MNILYRTAKLLGLVMMLAPLSAMASSIPTFAITGVQEVRTNEALVEIVYDSQGVEYAWSAQPKLSISYTNVSDGSSFSTVSIGESAGSRSTLFRLHDLKPNTKYTYKAVMYYGGQRYETADRSFTTVLAQQPSSTTGSTPSQTPVPAPLSPSASVTVKTLGISKVSSNLESIIKTGGYGTKNGVSLSITDTNARIVDGETFEYSIQYHNANTKTLRTARIVVQLPDQYTFDAGDGNTVYSNNDNVVTIYLGSIGPDESGVVTFKAKATGGENVGVETKAVLIYTGGSVSAVDRDTYVGGSKSVLGATVFGSKFFPQTFFGWLLIIIVLIVIMIITRRYMTPIIKKEEGK